MDSGWSGIAPLIDQTDNHGLAYLSFPQFACAATLPPGFYALKPISLPKGEEREQRVLFRGLFGGPVVELPQAEEYEPLTGTGVKLVTASPATGGEEGGWLWSASYHSKIVLTGGT